MTNQVRQFPSNQPLVAVLAILLNSIVQNVQPKCEQISSFTCKTPPKVGIRDYITRIYKYMHCSQDCLVMALIYIDRLQDMNPEFTVTAKKIHKLMMTAVLIATKYNEDSVYLNSFYAKISGFTPQQLNKLEMQFLKMISFNSYISLKIFKQYRMRIDEYLQKITELKNSDCKMTTHENSTIITNQ